MKKTRNYIMANNPVNPTGPLSFSTLLSAATTTKKNYLYATSDNTSDPILFTSSNPAVVAVGMTNSYWNIHYLGAGTTDITATQGSNTVTKTVTVTAPVVTGRTINVGSGSGTVEISSSLQSLLPGDTVFIAGGTYTNINIHDIIVPDGSAPIYITCTSHVEVAGDFNSWNFGTLRNVVIDGSRVPGNKYGMLMRDTNYYGIYVTGPMNYVTFQNFEYVNVLSTGWYWTNALVYDGTPNSYLKGCRFYNLRGENAGPLDIEGNIDVTLSTGKIVGLCVDFQFIGCEFYSSSPGNSIRVGCGQDIVFKDITFDNVNTTSNYHNANLFVQGTCDLINCFANNFEGNIVRLWYFTIIDGNINGRTTLKDCNIYGNVAFTSRKYSFFEYQAFDQFYLPGLTDGANFNFFHNTVGNLNQNIPTVFTGTLVDNYALHNSSTLKVFNNILIAPVNTGEANSFFTYQSSVGPDGSETQTGDTWEWNNRIYLTHEIGHVNPANLALQAGSTAIGTAISYGYTSLFTNDVYGNNVSMNNIGAIQCMDIVLPTGLAVPTAPTTDTVSALDRMNGNRVVATFMFDVIPSDSHIGIKNYDIDINGVEYTSLGGYSRVGVQDPVSLSPYFRPVAGATYRFGFRGRDWLDNVGPWSTYTTFKMANTVADATTALTLTKTSGGTLVNNSNVYTATAGTVYASAGVSIPVGDAARLIFTQASTPVTSGYFGFSSLATITSLSQLTTSMATSRSDASPIRACGYLNGVQFANTWDYVSPTILSLYLDYNGSVWVETSADGGITWNRLYNASYSQLVINKDTNAHYIQAVIEVGDTISNPRYIHYPAAVIKGTGNDGSLPAGLPGSF